MGNLTRFLKAAKRDLAESILLTERPEGGKHPKEKKENTKTNELITKVPKHPS